MRKYIYIALLASSVLHSSAELKELSKMSLEELLNVQVSSTSRREESQHMAPGIVTVVSSQEISQFGARHLRDVIDRLVGIQVIGSHQDYHSKTSMRGVNSSHHEGHVLVLLNGRPVRQATDGGLNSDFYLGFPLNTIDHIEVVRGPGSVIYGTNAVAGVINIITKSGKTSMDETRVDLQAGSYGRRQVQVSAVSGDIDYSLNLGLNYITAEGDTFEGLRDQDGNIGSYEWAQKSKNLLVSGEYKNLSLEGMLMDNDLDSASSAFQFPAQPIRLKRYFLDLGYQYDISSGWDVSLHYTLNKDSAEWQINETAGYNRSDAQSDMIESILRGNIDENLNVLFGVSYVYNESGFQRGLPQGSRVANRSFYAQADYMLSSKQKLIAGIQWNKPDNVKPDFSPRAGFIQGIGEHMWLKLLYSEAYRSPTLVETNLNAPQLKGNPSLNPEKIETYDIQLIHQSTKTYAALALYHSKLDNLIVRIPGTPTTHENQGYVKFQGLEFEGRAEVQDDITLIGNFSYQKNKTDSGIEQSTFAPELMLKAGITYSGIRGLTLSTFDSYIGASTDLNVTNIAPAINPKADAYNLLTANIVMDTGKLWRLGEPGHSLLSVFMDNLLDEKVYAPDLNFANQNNTIPHHWGRGVYVSYTYKF